MDWCALIANREQFTTYDERDGLPASLVHGILEDRSGNLWVSTAGGLSRFNPRAKTFTNYYEADGLAGSAFEGYPAACRSRARPDVLRQQKRAHVILAGPNRGEAIHSAGGTDWILIAERAGGARSRLGARTVHHVYAVADTVSRAEHVLLPVRRSELRGSATEPVSVHARAARPSWHRVDADHRLATFTTLPAGNYTLRVQGSNNRGVWNEQGVALHLQILPPWWATWWFRAICAVMLG